MRIFATAFTVNIFYVIEVCQKYDKPMQLNTRKFLRICIVFNQWFSQGHPCNAAGGTGGSIP